MHTTLVFTLLVARALGAIFEVTSGGAPEGESDLPSVKLTLDSGAAVYLHGDDGAIKTSTGATITAADVLTETGKSLNTLAQSLQNLANAVNNLDPTKIQPGTVDSTEFGLLNGVHGDTIQTQLNSKATSVNLEGLRNGLLQCFTTTIPNSNPHNCPSGTVNLDGEQECRRYCAFRNNGGCGGTSSRGDHVGGCMFLQASGTWYWNEDAGWPGVREGQYKVCKKTECNM